MQKCEDLAQFRLVRIHENDSVGVVVPSVFAPVSFLFRRFCLAAVIGPSLRHYNQPLFATSFFFRDHFSRFFSISFRWGPHLLSIFERWLCIEFRSHETDASGISRGMLVRSYFSLYLSVPLSFCRLSLVLPFLFAFSLRRRVSSRLFL